MIRVTIEMCPHGDESKPRTIATFKIANVGGPEHFMIEDTGAAFYDVNAVIDGVARSCRLVHNRDDGVIVLVERALTRFR